MALTVPNNPKVYTTKYENFRGVDFTNDATNIWYRRSPDAVNMLPDESGRPFKRHGWKTVITNDLFRDVYEDSIGTYSGEIIINRCHYFELSGINFIMIFTNIALFMWNDSNGGTIGLVSANIDVINSYERAFFFEGNGTSAFYVYGNYKVWWFKYDASTDSFSFSEIMPYIPKLNYEADGTEWFSVEEGIYIPTVRIGCKANGDGGELYESVNMMGKFVSEDYENNEASAGVYEITLPVNVTGVDDILVFSTDSLQFDTMLEVIDTGAPSSTQVLLDTTGDVAVLKFSGAITGGVAGEDKVKVVYPRVTITTADRSEISGTLETATA